MTLINFSGITKRENEPPIGMFIIKMRLIALLTPGRPLSVGYVVNDFELQVPKLRTKPKLRKPNGLAVSAVEARGRSCFSGSKGRQTQTS